MKLIEILSGPEKWCKRSLANDADGHGVFNPSDKDAVSWCLRGAMMKMVDSTHELHAAERVMCDVVSELAPEFSRSWGGDFIAFNNDDKTTYETLIPVITEFDKRYVRS